MTDDKSKSVANYKLGRQCGPDNLDERTNPEIDPAVAASYPARDETKYSYNFENKTHKVLVMFGDGHHGPDRWDLSQNDPGSTAEPQHEHDDYKRPTPTTLDAQLDPKDSRVGFLAQSRLPDSRDVLNVPGDKLGPSPAERAEESKIQGPYLVWTSKKLDELRAQKPRQQQ